jgi:DNA-binding transcriptional regulator YhcF (GntR family)
MTYRSHTPSAAAAQAAVITTEKDAGDTIASFTSQKLDLIDAVNADARISGKAFKVLVCVAQHVSQKSGHAFPSIETISVKTRLPIRTVERALATLRTTGWVRSRRVFDHRTRRTHNRYWLLTDNLNAILDEQVQLRDAQKAKREAARNVAQPAAGRGTVRQQSATGGGKQSATSGGVTPEKEHLTRISASKETVLVVERGDPAADFRYDDGHDEGSALSSFTSTWPNDPVNSVPF